MSSSVKPGYAQGTLEAHFKPSGYAQGTQRVRVEGSEFLPFKATGYAQGTLLGYAAARPSKEGGALLPISEPDGGGQ